MIKEIYLGLESFLLKFKRKKHILFVVSNDLMLSYCLPIFNHLKDDNRISFWFCFFDSMRFKKGNLTAIIKNNGLKTVPTKLMPFIPWDLVLYPYHGPYARKTCKQIYIGHGLNSGKLTNGKYLKFADLSRDIDGAVKYDKIFACHESEVELTKRHFPDHYPKMQVMGNLLLDEMLAQKDNRTEILNRCQCDPSRKTIMIATSWGPKSLPQTYKQELITQTLKLLDQYNIIFSIHSNNFININSNEFDWAKALNAVKEKNFCALQDNESSMSFLPAADILIMDHTSVGLFYLFLGRPIVFFDNQVEFAEDAHILLLKEAAYNIQGIDNLSQSVANAIKTFDPQKTKTTANKVCSHVGQSWDRYREEIFDSLGFK